VFDSKVIYTTDRIEVTVDSFEATEDGMPDLFLKGTIFAFNDKFGGQGPTVSDIFIDGYQYSLYEEKLVYYYIEEGETVDFRFPIGYWGMTNSWGLPDSQTIKFRFFDAYTGEAETATITEEIRTSKYKDGNRPIPSDYIELYSSGDYDIYGKVYVQETVINYHTVKLIVYNKTSTDIKISIDNFYVDGEKAEPTGSYYDWWTMTCYSGYKTEYVELGLTNSQQIGKEIKFDVLIDKETILTATLSIK
jgi:hypothetical protein